MLEVVAGVASLSAAEAGATAEVDTSAAAENDKAPTSKLRMEVRLPLRAMFFFLLIMNVPPSLRRGSVWIVDAVADDVDAWALARVVGGDRPLVDVGDAAQCERQRSGLARGSNLGGLLGLQFKRDGPADHVVGAFFFLRRLVDGEDSNIGQCDLGDDKIGQLRIRILDATGENDVDAIVGQNESTGAGFRGNFRRHGAISAGQDRGHEAG